VALAIAESVEEARVKARAIAERIYDD